jgi:hypothetical protein
MPSSASGFDNKIECRAKWSKESWKKDLAVFLHRRPQTQSTTGTKESSSAACSERKPFGASLLASLLLRRVRDDRIEEVEKRRTPCKESINVTRSTLTETCFRSSKHVLGVCTLKLHCINIIAKHLLYYDTRDLSEYFEMEEEDAIYFLSGYSACYDTMKDENISVFCQRQCRRLVVGNVSQEAFMSILPRFISLGGDGDLDWETFVPKTAGCFLLRELTFVKTPLGTSELRMIRESLPGMQSFRFIAVDIRNFTDFLDELELFASLEKLEIAYASFLIYPFLEILLNRVRQKTTEGERIGFKRLRSIVLCGFEKSEISSVSCTEDLVSDFLSNCEIELQVIYGLRVEGEEVL